MEDTFLPLMALFFFSYCMAAVLFALFYVKKMTKAMPATVASLQQDQKG